MARRSFKLKRFLSGALAVFLVGGLILGIVSITGNDSRSLGALAFKVGGIDAKTGDYVKTERSIYTAELFSCDGLEIAPDFEAKGAYQVFYYDGDGEFIGASKKMRSTDGTYKKGEDFPIAKYARVVITPDIPTDEDGTSDTDFKIRFFETATFAREYHISVAKDQREITGNLFKDVKDGLDFSGFSYSSSPGSHMESDRTYNETYRFCHSEIVKVGGFDTLAFENYLGNNFPGFIVMFWDADKIYISDATVNSDGFVDIPPNACYAVLESAQGVYFNNEMKMYAIED